MITLDYAVLDLQYMSSLSYNFEEFSNDLERTADGIFRRAVPPPCPECGVLMSRNGHNSYCKSTSVASRWGSISKSSLIAVVQLFTIYC